MAQLVVLIDLDLPNFSVVARKTVTFLAASDSKGKRIELAEERSSEGVHSLLAELLRNGWIVVCESQQEHKQLKARFL